VEDAQVEHDKENVVRLYFEEIDYTIEMSVEDLWTACNTCLNTVHHMRGEHYLQITEENARELCQAHKDAFYNEDLMDERVDAVMDGVKTCVMNTIKDAADRDEISPSTIGYFLEQVLKRLTDLEDDLNSGSISCENRKAIRQIDIKKVGLVKKDDDMF
jgi:hypothetical protein